MGKKKKEVKKIQELPTYEQIEKELARERYEIRYGQTLRSTIYILIAVSAVAVLLLTLFFPVFRVYGTSMIPTVNEGEVVVSVKGVTVDYGDMVVVKYNEKLLIKRLIAGPGSVVDIDEDGNVYVDGELFEEPYLQEKAKGNCTQIFPYTVPENRYFILGDNREKCHDSRNKVVGCIPEGQIIGKAILRVWPFETFGRLY